MRDFLLLHRVEMAVLILVAAVFVNLFLRFKWVRNTITSIIDDTLKVNDGPVRRFSGTKLTMLTAFASVLWSYHYIIIKDGFNEVAFISMCCISTGVAITGAYSKRINPPTETKVEPPVEQQPGA